MNLLFVYLRPVLPTHGGTERVAHTVAQALRKQGHTIYFIATKATEKDAKLNLPSNYFLIDEATNHETRKQIIVDTCAKFNIDVLFHIAGETGDYDIFSNKVIPNTKIISCLHFDVYGFIKHFLRGHSTSRLKKWVIDTLYAIGINLHYLKWHAHYRRCYREMLDASDAVVVVTPIIAEQLKQFTGINSCKIVSILNPVPFDNVQPAYDTRAKEKLIIYAGHLSPTKHVEKILKAWAEVAPRHTDWKLEIAGDGKEKANLMHLINSRNIPRVHFHGRISDVNSLYNRAEYFLLASDCESFGCVVVESLAYGCYPIIMDYPSAKVVIPDSRIGIRLKKHSSTELAKALDYAISNNITNRYNMDAITRHLESFNMEKLVMEWQALLTKITHQ